jgi:hypothetical protein
VTFDEEVVRQNTVVMRREEAVRQLALYVEVRELEAGDEAVVLLRVLDVEVRGHEGVTGRDLAGQLPS